MLLRAILGSRRHRRYCCGQECPRLHPRCNDQGKRRGTDHYTLDGVAGIPSFGQSLPPSYALYTFVLVLNATPNARGPIPHIDEKFSFSLKKKTRFQVVKFRKLEPSMFISVCTCSNTLKAHSKQQYTKANSSTHFCILTCLEIGVFPIELLVF